MALAPLPIDAHLETALRLLRESANLVVQAPPGAGKTTRLPAALLDDPAIAAGAEVWVLEPRRIAARMAAERVARERGTVVGAEVGYRVRFQHAASHATRLCFVTEGILVRRLQGDPELRGIAAVVFDEFHERNLEADLSLAFLREIQETIRPDLRLVVMSATLDPEPIRAYLGGCPLLSSEGRAYPITIEHSPGARDIPVEERVAGAVSRLLAEGMDGSMLVFLPGAAEIRRTLAALETIARGHGLDLRPLHGDIPPDAQQIAVREGPRPRIVAATNVAEASITVEGVDAVIDSGLVRVVRFDPHRGLDRRHTEWISRASAVQRAGRAGRVGPGRCLRLYSESDFAAMSEAVEPEVCRTDLSGAVLQILAWGTRDPFRFAWLTPPDAAMIERGLLLLRNLGAVEGDPPALTAAGRILSAIPAHPRQARMLLEARSSGCVPEASLMAALSSERDFRLTGPGFGTPRRFRGAATHAPSDLFILAEDLETARTLRFDPISCASLGIDARAAQACARTAEHLRRAAAAIASVPDRRALSDPLRDPEATPWGAQLEESLLRSIASAYSDRLVRRRAPGSREGIMVGGMGTRLDPSSAVGGEEFYVALEADPMRDATGRYVLVRRASGVKAAWLRELFPNLLRTVESVQFDENSERVSSRRVTLLHDLPVEEKQTSAPDPDLAAGALFEAACRRPERAIEWTRDLEDLVKRLRWLSARRPELTLPAPPPGAVSGAPAVDPMLLAALCPLCRDRRSFAELRQAAILDSLMSLLDPQTRRRLEAEAPARFVLPSGRSARVEYRVGEAPVLAGRIQEFFGGIVAPKIGGTPVTLQLLAPSQRPVQVTSDLAGFWKTVYPKLRPELRRRYPKHAWPEDPLTARPESRPSRKG